LFCRFAMADASNRGEPLQHILKFIDNSILHLFFGATTMGLQVN
jgi:hypothetical protein